MPAAPRAGVLAGLLLPWFALGPSALAETILTSEGWPNTSPAFAQFGQRIESYRGRNLLARRQSRLVPQQSSALGRESAALLTDGRAGERCEGGRVFLDGQPSVITYYLGGPKTIKEIGLFTFNGDARANQDFEVRLVNHSARPGQPPEFPAEPTLTTGPKILGRNGGGFHTRFVDSSGGPLVPFKADWVQFRIWRTYNVKAGEPARSKEPQGASTIIELEVLGEEHDVVLPTPEQLAHEKALREAPRAPEFVDKPAWRETLVASREAIVRWEATQDRLALFDGGASVGPWHVLGPLGRENEIMAEIDRQSRVDLGRTHIGKDRTPVAWQKREDLSDGHLVDLSGLITGKEEAIYLCRSIRFDRPFERDQLLLAIAMGEGWARWLPKGHRLQQRGPIGGTGLQSWALQGDAGDHQVLIRLTADREGKCRFWFSLMPTSSNPGGGDGNSRAHRRGQLLAKVRQQFDQAPDRAFLDWEIADGLWDAQSHRLGDWVPGLAEASLAPRYREATVRRLAAVEKDLAAEAGTRAQAIASRKAAIRNWIEAFRKSAESPTDAAVRERYYHAAALQSAVGLSGRLVSLRLAVEDHAAMFPGRYKAEQQLACLNALETRMVSFWEGFLKADQRAGQAIESVRKLQGDLDETAPRVLLESPLLAFDKLLLVKGHSSFAANWTGPNHLGQEMVVLSPVRPGGQLTTIHKGPVSDMDLHWDGKRILFSDSRALWEIQADGSGLRRVSREDPPVTHYDACYLPNGKIVCVSNACEQAVPCTGGADVGNLHLMDSDGGNERRVTYDQDHDWNPAVMNDGRVLYTRWEYTDLPHYFSRMLFRMNPDGSGQMEYYGSNSYWPNAMYWPRPIPGHPTMVVCVVSGHHGVSRVGELVLLDPARGRHEAQGAVQRIPGYGQRVEPIIQDNLVGDSWPKFAAPYPLAEPGTNKGAGKYFLVSVQENEFSTWDLYLVDVFDNLTPILRGGYMTPIPLRPRPMPPEIPSQLRPQEKDAVIYLADVYQGDGLRGYPRGSIQALRVGTHHYRYAGNGDTRASSYEGGWDVKRILGTVPVHEDGSALFRVPANTPIFVQPLDAEGKAQQQMRSWYTGMPGETASCIGCHEKQNSGPVVRPSLAARQRPVEITPWNGPVRGFSFDREVQPVLDRRCVGCHDGQPQKVAAQAVQTPDLRAKRLHRDFQGEYSPAYMELQRYVRRAGYESDNHMHWPAEFEADTSQLVQMLKKGHYQVELTADQWQRLYAWIDFNIPYPANWRESHRPPANEQVQRRAKYKKLYSTIDDRDEDPLPLPPIAAFESPRAVPTRPPAPPTAPHWPMTAEQAVARRAAVGLPVEKELSLTDGVTMKFSLVPAGQFVMGDSRGFPDELPQAAVSIDRPFYLGRFEVTNAQYAVFDPSHDSGYVEGRGKDRTTRGTPIHAPEQPAVRVSWNRAMAFCRWLSEKTGRRATLPTEAQWEWACRAGSAASFHVGDPTAGMKPFANIADQSAAGWNFGRAEAGYHDGAPFTAPVGRFPANAWGLCDMHGNVAEWCLSSYRPYPYTVGDGRDNPTAPDRKVVRGGSWNDLLRYSTAASRWRYQPHHPVYNVGFRVLLETTPAPAVASR